jgi:hypothetical protein
MAADFLDSFWHFLTGGRRSGQDFELHAVAKSGKICALLGYYAASNGNLLPKFRDNVSVPSSSVKKSKKKKNLDP